ncbi:MAG: hypothetical protein P8Z80_11945 [Pseudolabrys sp.]
MKFNVFVLTNVSFENLHASPAKFAASHWGGACKSHGNHAETAAGLLCAAADIVRCRMVAIRLVLAIALAHRRDFAANGCSADSNDDLLPNLMPCKTRIP